MTLKTEMPISIEHKIHRVYHQHHHHHHYHLHHTLDHHHLHINNQSIYRSQTTSHHHRHQHEHLQLQQQSSRQRGGEPVTLAIQARSTTVSQEARHLDDEQQQTLSTLPHQHHHHHHQEEQHQLPQLFDSTQPNDTTGHQLLQASGLTHLLARHNQREQRILAASHGQQTNRSTSRSKQRSQIQFFLLSAFAYILSPIDLIPEAIFGIFGILDDLVFLFMCLFCVAIILLYPLLREVQRTMSDKLGFKQEREITANKST